MRVVVFGATGNVGSALMRTLSNDEAVSSVLGVARRVPELTLPKCAWLAADIASDPLDHLRGADVVVHLAWKIQPQRDEREMTRTNIVGSRRVVEAVLRHGVPALVYASSVGAYSPGPKEQRANESWPVDGVPSSVYSRHKAQVEAMLDAVEREHPALRIIRLRTSLVFQAAAASEVHRLFLGPLVPWHLPRVLRVVPRCDRLRFQATHATDIADAYRRAVLSDRRGPFNIAAEPVLTSQLIARLVEGRSFPVAASLLRFAYAAAYRLRLVRSEPGWLDMALATPIMDTQRAKAELGWTASRTSLDALHELFDGIGRGSGLATPPLAPRSRDSDRLLRRPSLAPPIV